MGENKLEGWCFDCAKPVEAGCVEGEHSHQLAVSEAEYQAMTEKAGEQ